MTETWFRSDDEDKKIMGDMVLHHEDINSTPFLFKEVFKLDFGINPYFRFNRVYTGVFVNVKAMQK